MALILYVDNVGGGSGYSGSSEGSPKAGGTGAATDTTATVTLSVDTPDLSTVLVGDTIRINGRTDGVRNTDIFEITAVDDTLDTVTVTPTPGSITSGVTWAIGGAFNDISGSLLVCRAGDRVFVKDSADYNETMVLSQVGGNTSAIIYEGYASVTGDGGIVTVNGQNIRSNGLNEGILIAHEIYYVFKNIEFINHIEDGAFFQSQEYMTFKNCRFNNNIRHGFNKQNISINSFENCQFNNNGGYGFQENISADHTNIFIDCEFMENASGGCFLTKLFLNNCVFFDNGNQQILSSGLTDTIFINHCTIDGKDKDTNGINFDSIINANIVVINNIVVGCASGFIAVSGIGERMTSRSNCFYDNIINYVNGTFTLENEVLINPKFNNRSIQDYRLNTGSPCIGAGYDASSLAGVNSGCDIGAYQSI